MVIGGIDREETKKGQKKQSRSELLKKRQENEHRQASCSHSSLVDNLEESDSEDCNANDGDTSYVTLAYRISDKSIFWKLVLCVIFIE